MGAKKTRNADRRADLHTVDLTAIARATRPLASLSALLRKGDLLADGVGFEPTIGGYPIHAFQACAFNRSATHPQEAGT